MFESCRAHHEIKGLLISQQPLHFYPFSTDRGDRLSSTTALLITCMFSDATKPQVSPLHQGMGGVSCGGTVNHSPTLGMMKSDSSIPRARNASPSSRRGAS